MSTSKATKNTTKSVKKEVINSILLKKTVGGGAVCAAPCVYQKPGTGTIG